MPDLARTPVTVRGGARRPRWQCRACARPQRLSHAGKQRATPQERAAAAVPAFRRGADNEQWCCCHGDVSDTERASSNGSIAVAGTQVASAPRVSRAAFLSHTSRCSVKFSSAHGGGRGREVCSPAPWRCVPWRVSASAKARRPAALSTPGGLGRYCAAQWHLARAVGKRFRGCRAKRLYVHRV
jgi:hypothetical protein